MLKYHHRFIILLEAEKAISYLDDMEPEERFMYVVENSYKGDLEVEKVRNMAKGWEKRVAQQEAKLHSEMKYRQVLIKEGVPA